MKIHSASERLFLEEVMSVTQKVRAATRGLPIGALIRSIRIQLGMSQSALARRAGVPQPTVSRIERGRGDTTLSTLHKILGAISCDLVVSPLLRDSVDSIRQKQARKVAQKRVEYLQGTMSLEDQEPDPRFIEELLRQEVGRIQQGPSAKLWEEE
jgi:transcriptional regulator with XRE-family HTH domain